MNFFYKKSRSEKYYLFIISNHNAVKRRNNVTRFFTTKKNVVLNKTFYWTNTERLPYYPPTPNIENYMLTDRSRRDKNNSKIIKLRY